MIAGTSDDCAEHCGDERSCWILHDFQPLWVNVLFHFHLRLLTHNLTEVIYDVYAALQYLQTVFTTLQRTTVMKEIPFQPTNNCMVAILISGTELYSTFNLSFQVRSLSLIINSLPDTISMHWSAGGLAQMEERSLSMWAASSKVTNFIFTFRKKNIVTHQVTVTCLFLQCFSVLTGISLYLWKLFIINRLVYVTDSSHLDFEVGLHLE